MTRAGLRAPVSTGMEDAIAGSRVLVVDDEPANVLVLERMFESVGLTEVHGLTDPRRTLEMVEAQPPARHAAFRSRARAARHALALPALPGREGSR